MGSYESDIETLREFRDYLGVTFPVLYDEGGLVSIDYAAIGPETGNKYLLLPTGILVGADGTILYFDANPDLDEVEALIRAELGL